MNMEPTAYHPGHLLDALLLQLHLNTDDELSRRLRVAPRVIKQIRAGTLPIGASMLIWMSEATGLSISELRSLMGDRRRTCRVSFARAPERARQSN
ncbi:MAG TPA: hypothetical protein VIM12_11550 [Noviherbaspirillum sp.]|jgi:plasmid maintenance system antidote protein VapI|uniref:hypothetical protein n=1 Tax=Noviherbaspirillum sp. TaxID=1926288 RepID=UPI002F95F6D8